MHETEAGLMVPRWCKRAGAAVAAVIVSTFGLWRTESRSAVPVDRRRARPWRHRAALALTATTVLLGSLVMMATEASATSVTSVTVSADSYLSGNTSATWSIGFTTSGTGNLVAGNAIRVDFPGIFTVTGASATLVSGFTGSCGTPSITTTGSTVIIQLTSSCALAANQAATLTITGVSASFDATNFHSFVVTTYTDTTTTTPIDGDGGRTGFSALNMLATVTYDTHASNGAATTSGAAPTDGSSPYSAASTSVTVLGGGTLALSGYTFAGWCTTNNNTNPTLCGGTHYNVGAVFTLGANTKLYSQWTAVTTVTLTYATQTSAGTSLTGTAPTDPSSPYTPGATVTVLSTSGLVAPTGYVLNGWCTTNNNTETSCSGGTHYNAGGTFTISTNTTLYPQLLAFVPVAPPPRRSPGLSIQAPATASAGQDVAVSAQVASDATGSISFLADATTVASVPVSSGTARYSVVGLRPGHHTITATYSGDLTYNPDTASTTVDVTQGPTVTSVSPAQGPSAGGTLVTITGTGFTGATGVSFGTVAAPNFSVISATSITATSPTGSSGAVDVTVTTPAGTSTTSSADQFTYQASTCASGSERFVCQVYLDLLGRTADQRGLRFWSGLLNAGTVSHLRFASSVVITSEYTSRTVTDAYQAYLGRSPSNEELNNWQRTAGGGLTRRYVQVAVLGSDEYYARNKSTTTSFVTALYRDVLNRAADAAGMSAWSDQLASGTSRAQVATAILASTEHANNLVAGWYQAYLRRTSSTQEVAGWVNQLTSDAKEEDVIAQIIGSAEYYTRFAN